MNQIKNYVKRPVVVQAIQWIGTNDREVIQFCGNRGVDYDDINGLFIYTLEGRMKADIGDYIIKGVAGENYPCKENIFHLTYEEVK